MHSYVNLHTFLCVQIMNQWDLIKKNYYLGILNKIKGNKGRKGTNHGLFRKLNVCQESCKPSRQMHTDVRKFWKVVRKLWESCEKDVRKLWENCEKVLWKLWKSCGKFVRKLWESCEKVVNKLWKSCEKVVRKLWESCEKVERKLWGSFKNFVKKLWES